MYNTSDSDSFYGQGRYGIKLAELINFMVYLQTCHWI